MSFYYVDLRWRVLSLFIYIYTIRERAVFYKSCDLIGSESGYCSYYSYYSVESLCRISLASLQFFFFFINITCFFGWAYFKQRLRSQPLACKWFINYFFSLYQNTYFYTKIYFEINFVVLNVINGLSPLLSLSPLFPLFLSSSFSLFSLLSPLFLFSLPLLFPPSLSPSFLPLSFSPPPFLPLSLPSSLSPLLSLSSLSPLLCPPLFSPLFSPPMSLPPLLFILTPPSSLLSNFFFTFMLLNEIHLFYDGIC